MPTFGTPGASGVQRIGLFKSSGRAIRFLSCPVLRSPRFQFTSRATPPPPSGVKLSLQRSQLSWRRGPSSWLSDSGVLEPSIRCPQGFGLLETNYRPLVSQSSGALLQVPHGDASVSPSIDLGWGLDGFDRPAGCLSAGSCSSGVLQISPLRSGQSVLPVPDPLLRLDDSPSSLYEGYGSCLRHSSSSGFPFPSLP